MQIPGVDWVVAAVLIAEIGVDMSVFLSVYHLAAWAGVRPGNHESAGKQKSGQAEERARPQRQHSSSHPARRRRHLRLTDQG
jgi:transposase